MEVVTSPRTLGEPDPLVEGYAIHGLIGEGGLARVYRATRLDDRALCALKVARARLPPDACARFELEAEIGRWLDHPNIVRVLDSGLCRGRAWIAMEHLEGRDLSDARDDGSLSFSERLRIVLRIARALDHAHARRVLHRDVKPSNIFLGEDGAVRLLDFGISKVAGYVLTQTGNINGTPRYMAPEQFSGREVDGRADEFSLGVVAFELFTGTLPWDSDSPYATMLAMCITEPRDFAEAFARGPLRGAPRTHVAALARIVHRAIATERESRFSTIAGFGEALETLLEELDRDEATQRRRPIVDARRCRTWARARMERLERDARLDPRAPRPPEAPEDLVLWYTLVALFALLTLGGAVLIGRGWS